MSQTMRRHIHISAAWPWALAGLIIGTPLAIISPPLALVLIAATGILGFVFIRPNGSHATATRLLAISIGLLIPAAVYWIVALTQINS